MSVQLTLYPQNYNGQYNLLSSDPFNLIADQDFSEIVHQNDTNAFIYTGLTYAQQHYLIYNAAIDFVMGGNGSSLYFNAWKVFSSGIPNIERIGGTNPKLQFWYQHTSGFVMRVPGTTTGAQWEFSVRQRYKESGSEGGELRLLCLDGWAGSFAADVIHNVAGSPSGDNTPETFSTTFTANGSYSYVLMTWRATNQSNANDNLIIDRVSLKEVTTTPTGSSTLVSNGSVIVDLYEDEDIPLTLSVDNFKNSAEKVQSYSKAFKLPASKRNNKIFDSIFEITRETQGTTLFNPYIKTKATLKQNGFLLFEGYLKLIDITEKNGERSYNVNLYSEAIALADVLKDKTFNDIDLSELTHSYNYDNIENSWNSGTGLQLATTLSTDSFAYDSALGTSNTNVLKYPFVNWIGSINLSDGTNGTSGMPELTRLEEVFRPFIQIKYLINRIFEPTPFSYTSEFFDTIGFESLFMDFNWGSDNNPAPAGVDDLYYGAFSFDPANPTASPPAVPIGTSYTNIPVLPAAGTWTIWTPPNYNTTTGVLTATVSGESYNVDYNLGFLVTNSGAQTVTIEWLHNTTAINQQTYNAQGSVNSNYTYQEQKLLLAQGLLVIMQKYIGILAFQ